VHHRTRPPFVTLILASLALGMPLGTAMAQNPPAPAPSSGPVVTPKPDGTTVVSPQPITNPQLPRDPSKAESVRLNFPVDSSLLVWVKYFADLKRMNFIIPDAIYKEIENKKITIISNQDVSPNAAWEAFLSALEVSGYSLSITGNNAKLVKLDEANQRPIRVGTGQPGESDAYVTQLIELENARVDDMAKIIGNMAGPNAKIVTYPPTNTMIITDTAANIRKMYQIMKGFDVASPKSTMEIYPLQFATASDVKQMIETLYGTAETAAASSDRSSRTTSSTPTRPSRTRSPRRGAETPAPGAADPVSAGDESKFIAQVIDDERTNSLIVLANEDGHAAVRELISKIDVNIETPGEIHVRYLEHAKAEEVAQVLSQLSQGGSGAAAGGQSRRTQRGAGGAAGGTAASPASPTTRTTPARAAAGEDDDSGSAAAAFDSGMRIAADEATNSLVIIANMDDYRVVEQVIDKLDVERKQVFVDAVVMELSSEDSLRLGLAGHIPQSPGEGSVGYIGAQLGASSLGVSTDALTGLALGVFGESVNIPVMDPTTGLLTQVPIPTFGVALNALKSSGSTNIISNPSLMTLDNEEASIVVGRKIPFPTTSGMNNLGQPVISFQREDVAITLRITPRVNSANYVTLELEVEVQEVEESAQSAQVTAAGGGFITSQRKVETVALVSDNQTMVVGGLVGTTEGTSESKVPVLGDVPLVGALFRSQNSTKRKTNLLIFLTPHIVDEPEDIIEIQRVKEAQRQEFLRRFYGKSRTEFWEELQDLLRYSMNVVDEPSAYIGPTTVGVDLRLDEQDLNQETRAAIQDALQEGRGTNPGEGAGQLPDEPPPQPQE
jgi:general secretion pathway protein D